MTKIKASGPSVAIIHFDPAKVASLRNDQREHLAYHMVRLLAGEGTALSEWNHLGLTVDLEPDTDGGPEG